MDESTLGFIFALIFATAVLLLIFSGLLMLACRIAGVRVPAFGRAALIVIAAMVAQTVAGVALAFVLGLALRGQPLQQDAMVFEVVTQSLAVLLGLFINAWIYSLMLPTSYVKGIIVYIIQIAILIAIAAIIGFIVGLGVSLLRN